MEVFVARQPIYTRNKEVFAYELLYRQGYENQFPIIDGDRATTDVIINSFLNIGIDTLTNGKPCFINFTENLLSSGLPNYLNPEEIVVEILETVELNEELLRICKGLKARGYKIALDDFVLKTSNTHTLDLLRLTDIVKVDFRDTTENMRKVIETLSGQYNFILLAEKIETSDEFELALKSGYAYFQGYFFSKPVILSSHDVPEYIQNGFALITHLSTNEPNLNYITQLIEQDLSLSYKLLKLINSAAFRPVSKIKSIKQAVVRLGYNELIKWLYILSLRGDTIQNSEWTREMFNTSLLRAKASELIATSCKGETDSSPYFLTGLFSLMDVLLGMEMTQVLNVIPLQEDIYEALIGVPNHLRDLLNLTQAIEKGLWEQVTTYCQAIQLNEEHVLRCYNEAFDWAFNIIKTDAS